MFYETTHRDRSNLPHDPFKAIVAPRPIGWISTRALDGRINLAPYSFFNGFSSTPPMVGFSSDGWKDSATFAKESGEFVANLATFELRDPMNATSAPLARGANEFEHAGLTMAECRLVAAPRVAESPASLECKVVEIVEIRSRDGAWSGNVLTIGEVVAFHIDEAYIREGRFDTAGAHPLARCG
jgi:flavin reductase (DIM6/NTAB) family NADH-FMN oxidoreductase RutF